VPRIRHGRCSNSCAQHLGPARVLGADHRERRMLVIVLDRGTPRRGNSGWKLEPEGQPWRALGRCADSRPARTTVCHAPGGWSNASHGVVTRACPLRSRAGSAPTTRRTAERSWLPLGARRGAHADETTSCVARTARPVAVDCGDAARSRPPSGALDAPPRSASGRGGSGRADGVEVHAHDIVAVAREAGHRYGAHGTQVEDADFMTI